MSGIATDSAVTVASGNAEINALLWDRHWSHNNLTFSFPTGTAEYAYGSQNFGALLAQQATAANEILGQFSAVSLLSFAAPAAGTNANLRFARASATDGNIDGVITFGDNPATVAIEADERIGTAYGIPPSNSGPPGNYDNRRWGDMWFNANPPGGANDMTNPLKGNYGYATFMHELGHALGFDHPHGDAGIGNHFGNLAANWDSSEFTVMTYRNFPGAAIGANKPANNDPQSLMVLDIAALQYVYGANFSANNGPTTYKFRPNTGNMEVNGVPENAATAPGGNVVFRTIWDGGGEDTYDLSSYGTNLSIDLRAASATDPTVGWTLLDTSAANPSQRANLGLNPNGSTHWALGNIANARLFNGDLRSLIENAIGGSGGDSIIGNNAANTLTGNGGADTLFGNDGPDRLEGGAGSDLLNGGNGIDQAQYTFAASGVTVDLLFNPLNTGEAAGDTFVSIENLRGTNFNDILRGDDGDNGIGGGSGGSDRLVGRGGNDSLAGGDGDDNLDGGEGFDTYDGGTGNDAYFVQDAQGIDLLFENPGAGHDTVQASARWVLGANFEDLALTGAANVNGFGNALNNRLAGNSGNNYLQGFAAFDTLAGGAGNDYYELSDLNSRQFLGWNYDTVIEGANAGIDTVSVTSIDNPDTFSGIETYTLGANIENGTIVGGLAFNLRGNALANVLTGNTAANVLTGGEGGDTYVLTDLAKTDVFAIYAYDTVVETGGTGIDTVVVTAIDNPDTFSSIETYTLGATVENGTIVGTLAFNLRGNALANVLSGNGVANTLTGNNGNDTLVGGLGIDTLIGGFGNDTYVMENGTDTVSDSDGIDTITSTVTRNLNGYAAIENLTLLNVAGALYGTGNNLNNVLTGNNFNNILSGGVGADTLNGNAGADALKGGVGKDTLSGGQANDRFIFDSAPIAANADTITDFANVVGSNNDFFQLDNLVFATLGAPGVMNAAFFFVGAAAHDANDHIIYNQMAGQLLYDTNGNAASGVSLIATLANKPTLTAADFVVI